jgi:ABC-type sugar transport system substrate-binding protein
MSWLSRRKPPERILFVSSTTSSVDNEDTFDYFSSIISELAFKIQRMFPQIEFVLKVPQGERTAAADQQIHFIEDAISADYPYKCIVVSPVDRDRIYDKSKAWIPKYGNDRLIFIDQGFTLDDYPYFHMDKVDRPPYVQADWVQGGEVAGHSMRKLMEVRNVKVPHIVIIEGLVGSPQRVKGFQAAMRQSNVSDFKPHYPDGLKGRYSMKSARELFEPYLLECISENIVIDGVFATNDEMALGVRDALTKNKDAYMAAFSSRDKFHLPAVIGFDGIKDLTFHIDNNDDFI